MSQIILDISANTHKNDMETIKKLIDEIQKIDTYKHEIIFKTQLFKNQPPNIPTDPKMFSWMKTYANYRGYECTSSVFDEESLKVLNGAGNIPFIKIPCRPEVYHLINYMSGDIPVYISISNYEDYLKIDGYMYPADRILICIPKYPAEIKEYEKVLTDFQWIRHGISDHTIGLKLWKKYKPKIWEKHYVLEHDSANPDGGAFAVDPKMLAEIL